MDSQDEFALHETEICGRPAYGILAEFCVHNGIVPRADYTGGNGHVNKFVCTIKLNNTRTKGDFTVSGMPGTTKKSAQHMAAVAVFHRLKLGKSWAKQSFQSSVNMRWQVLEDVFSNVAGTEWAPPVLPVVMLDLDSNPVAAASSPGAQPTDANILWVNNLTEFCQDHQYSLPEFKILESKGPSHQPKFTMMCSVKEDKTEHPIESKVTACTNKKQIKKMVAQKQLMKLKAMHGLPWDGPAMPPGDLEPVDDYEILLYRGMMQSATRDAFNATQLQKLVGAGKGEIGEYESVRLMRNSGCTKSLEECMNLVTHQLHAAVRTLRHDASVATILNSSAEVLGSDAIDLLEKLAKLQGSPQIKMAYYPVIGGSTDNRVVFGRFENPISHITKVGSGGDFAGAKEQAAVKIIQFIRILHTSNHETAV